MVCKLMCFWNKSTIAEMLLICSFALAIGLVWNRGMLYDAWSGRPVGAGKISSSPGPASIPLPLGLMQAKEFYDHHEAVFIDARDGGAYRQAHIDGALSLPVGELDRRLADVSRSIPLAMSVVVYCNGFGCHDSNTVAERLAGAGYTSVFVYEGGFPEWQNAGYPTAGDKHAP